MGGRVGRTVKERQELGFGRFSKGETKGDSVASSGISGQCALRCKDLHYEYWAFRNVGRECGRREGEEWRTVQL